ncbi:hypothetical protein K437DRAFT_241485 [Tilletiaria anomala UBC 951]|uniref:UBX domain-containing protein n=1 Tax=Tilletiaria anomala (strain ATCC 24038 / CBS 436.72 / UBC 951) TaxID=1037660 RepID=A0A066V6F4_TILAU|nr:uncharacterized protein K437DRAFT_241485 [Tilletiaria anomala UBC 951]KDN35818.1 hypothetical protein K437DRAFT_241485 [Tilletiaria anomala UBC 951]
MDSQHGQWPSEGSDVARLQSLLSARGLSAAVQPDAEALQTMLAVAGDPLEAAKLIFESFGAERRISGEALIHASPSRRQLLEVDDSDVTQPFPSPLGIGLASRQSRSLHRPGVPQESNLSVFSTVFSALALPFTLLRHLLVFIARFMPLRAFLPPVLFGEAEGGVERQQQRGRVWKDTDPIKAAERYRLGLEHFVAAQSNSQHEADGDAHALADKTRRRAKEERLRHRVEQPIASSSTTPVYPPSRIAASDIQLRIPTNLLTTSYNQAIQQAKDEHKILVIVLESLEHQHCEQFRREVLLNEKFVNVISRRDFLVWGGDIGERDAYQVSNLLQAYTYPFVAFASLQPSRNRTVGLSSSSRPPRMAILSRQEGSPSNMTSAARLTDHIQDLLLPRVLPYLQRLQRDKDRRQRERELREEQDRAYQRAAAADAERVRQARENERRKREAVKQKEQELRREEETKIKYGVWRRWARRYLVPIDAGGDASDCIKFALRLPTGERLERHFATRAPVEALFAYVESATQSAEEEDEDDVPLAPPADYTHSYRFAFVSGYPRAKIEPETSIGKRLYEVDALKNGGAFIVEGQIGFSRIKTIDTTDEDTEGQE